MPHRPVAAVVPAAGSGQRLGAEVPKALVEVHGRTLLARSVSALVADPRVGLVVLAAPEGLVEAMRRIACAAAGDVPVVAVGGGTTRADSVRRALAAVPGEFSAVLVHDAARALVPTAVVSAVVDAVLGGAVAVVPGLPVVDTVREVGPDGTSRTVDRSRLRAVQTPQGFDADVLRRAHRDGDREATDDAGLVEALGLPVTIVEGHPLAFKVTTPLDLVLATALVTGEAAT